MFIYAIQVARESFVHDFDSSSTNLTRLPRRTHRIPQELPLWYSVTAESLMSLY